PGPLTLPSAPLTVPPRVPLSAPLTVPPTLPSNWAWAGAAAIASAEAAASMNLDMSFSFELRRSFNWLLQKRTTAARGFIPRVHEISLRADDPRVHATGAADDAASDAALAGPGFGGQRAGRAGGEQSRGGQRSGEARPAHSRKAVARERR